MRKSYLVNYFIWPVLCLAKWLQLLKYFVVLIMYKTKIFIFVNTLLKREKFLQFVLDKKNKILISVPDMPRLKTD